MLRLIGSRILAVVPVLLIVSFTVFMMMALIPGDIAITLAGGENASPERVAEVRAELGLDDPLLVQYASWLRGALVLDFGNSLLDGRPVIDNIMNKLPITFSIALAALGVGVVLGGLAGLVSGTHPGSIRDRSRAVPCGQINHR